MNIDRGFFGNGSGASRTHRAGHAVLRGPLDVNGQGRHGTGVWMRKTRIRIPPRAYRPPNDPLPRPGTISGTPDKYSESFECRSGPASTPIACPALIREGARRLCRTPIPLGVATASCPPTKRRPRVSRARHATPEWSPRPLEPAGGPWRGISKGSSCLGPHKPNRVSRVPRPTSTRGHDSIRFAADNQSRKNENKVLWAFSQNKFTDTACRFVEDSRGFCRPFLMSR